MTAMGALNVQLDQKTKDMLARMRVDEEGPDEGPDVQKEDYGGCGKSCHKQPDPTHPPT